MKSGTHCRIALVPVQVSDTTGADSSNKAQFKKSFFLTTGLQCDNCHQSEVFTDKNLVHKHKRHADKTI